jgi:hypothetical protein
MRSWNPVTVIAVSAIMIAAAVACTQDVHLGQAQQNTTCGQAGQVCCRSNGGRGLCNDSTLACDGTQCVPVGGQGGASIDAGSVGPDAGSVGPDAGSVGPDAGPVGPDAGSVGPDAGSVGPDGGSVGPDAGSVGPDAGSVGPEDANYGGSDGSSGTGGGLCGALGQPCCTDSVGYLFCTDSGARCVDRFCR